MQSHPDRPACGSQEQRRGQETFAWSRTHIPVCARPGMAAILQALFDCPFVIWRKSTCWVPGETIPHHCLLLFHQT